MTLYRLYRLRRRAGLSRRLALRLAIESMQRDRQFEQQRREVLRRAAMPFTTSRAGDL